MTQESMEELYRQAIKKFVDEIQDKKSLEVVYCVTERIWLKERPEEPASAANRKGTMHE